MLSENMWFTWCKPSNYSIFGEGKSDDGQIDKKTDRQNFLSKLIEKEMQKTKKGKSGIGGWVDGHQTEPRARHLALPLSQVTPLTNFDNI